MSNAFKDVASINRVKQCRLIQIKLPPINPSDSFKLKLPMIKQQLIKFVKCGTTPRMKHFLKKIIRSQKFQNISFIYKKITQSRKPKKFPSTDFGVSTMHKCWISDHHIFSIQDAKQILGNLGVSFYDHSLTGHWKYFYPSYPAEKLQVLDSDNTNKPYDYEHYDRLASEFAGYYGKWSQENVDFFWCSFKAYMVHVYSKCNRPIVLQLSFRFEGNMKSEPEEVEKLIAKLVELHTKGQLIILASNLYDKMYFEYFTDINIPIVRQCAHYIKERYQPIKNEILIGPGKGWPASKRKAMQIKEFFVNEPEITIKEIRELYPRYEYSDLCKHKAIIVLPYTIYTGSIVEYLAMGIPLFMPSIDLLSHWHVDDYLLAERKSDLKPMSGSIVKGKLCNSMPDPNDDYDLEAVKYWLKYCDWYQWPIETFSSLEELKQKLLNCDFDKISENMLAFDEAQYCETTLQWQKILEEIKTSTYK